MSEIESLKSEIIALKSQIAMKDAALKGISKCWTQEHEDALSRHESSGTEALSDILFVEAAALASPTKLAEQALSPNCGQPLLQELETLRRRAAEYQPYADAALTSQPLLELVNHIKQHTTHPQIDMDYYEWLNTADKTFMQKMIAENSAHGIAMYAFQAARTSLKPKQRN